jgi:hypothetical protein
MTDKSETTEAWRSCRDEQCRTFGRCMAAPMPCSEAHETTAPDALTLADQAFANARALVDTVTVSAPAYSLGGSVIGHYSVTLPRADAERILRRKVK